MSIAKKLKVLTKSAFARVNLALVDLDHIEQVEQMARLGLKAKKLGMLDDSQLRRALELLPQSTSQLNQDFFVLQELAWKTGGYFVEFGATNGFTYSNSLLLEREFGWTGILAEPARIWNQALRKSNRTASLVFDCVWSRTGETLTFNEADWAELSTIGEFEQNDNHNRHRTRSYKVNTISLLDMLKQQGSPKVIDYLSIDTEGSEYEILRAFDFQSYRFNCITCEHNHTEYRGKIHDLLASHGYRRKFEEFSEFDDWYVYAG